MASRKNRFALIAFALGLAIGSFALLAEGPATPVPIVVATIEKPSAPNGVCLVTAQVRDPQSNDVFFEPKIRGAEGQEAKASISDADRKVEVIVKTAPGCACGTYSMNVWTAGKLAYSRSGALEPKAP